MLMMSCRAPPCGSSDRMDNKKKEVCRRLKTHTRPDVTWSYTCPNKSQSKTHCWKKGVSIQEWSPGTAVHRVFVCVCVWCVCVCVCTYSGGGKKCQFAWLKVTVTVLASGHHFPDAKSACCWSGRLMSVVIAVNTQTHTRTHINTTTPLKSGARVYTNWN